VADLLLVGPIPPPSGGVATHLGALARVLARDGVAATVVDPRERLRFAGELARAAISGLPVHVHIGGHGPKPWGLVAACSASGRPTLVTVHSGLTPGFVASLTGAGRAALMSVLSRTARTICVSEPIAAALRAAGVPASQLTVASPFLPGGMVAGRPPARVAAARAAGLRIVAAAMASGPEYGAQVLVGGFARLAGLAPDTVLAVYGPGGADRDVARALEGRGLGERVLALGALDARAAAGVVAACDLFLRPTLADGDALSVREARALGRRVVASDAAARPPGTRLHPAGDWAALADAAAAALREPPPPASREDGYPALRAVYASLGALPARREEGTCAASPVV
jgi:glycogen synthase